MKGAKIAKQFKWGFFLNNNEEEVKYKHTQMQEFLRGGGGGEDMKVYRGRGPRHIFGDFNLLI